MKRLLLPLLFLASPALGAGNVSEDLCDNPGSNVTCVCSEPLTADIGTHLPGATVDPPGSTNGCNNGNSLAFSSFSSGTLSSDLASSVANPITVGGSGYVAAVSDGANVKIIDQRRAFTHGTWCSRVYMQYDPGWETGSCTNNKMARNDVPNSGSGQNNPGMEMVLGHNIADSGGTFYAFAMDGTDFDWSGSSPKGRLVRGGAGNLTFETVQGSWLRHEVCWDHNKGGGDKLWGRAKWTMITGPDAGDVLTWGPNGTVNGIATVHSGDKTYITSSGISGECGACAFGGVPKACDPARHAGKQWLSYAMVTHKSTVDDGYWIGPACEVESPGGCSGATPTATPVTTATPTATPSATPGGPTPTITPTATPTGTPTATPTPQPILCQMDFEGVGCVDSDAGETCSLTIGASYDADCADGDGNSTCALAGLKSGYATGDGAPEDVMWMDTTTHNCTADKEQVTVDFKFHWPAGSKLLRADQFRIMVAPGQFGTSGYTLAMRQTTEHIWHTCGPPGNTVGIGSLPPAGPADDTTYNVRINFDAANYDCNIYIDAESAGKPWGTGDTWKSEGFLDSPATGGTFAGVWHA